LAERSVASRNSPLLLAITSSQSQGYLPRASRFDARFIFELRGRAPLLALFPRVAPGTAGNGPGARSGDAGQMTRLRILQVEDDPDILEISRLALELVGGHDVFQF